MTKVDAKEVEVGRIPFLDKELIQKTDGAVESGWLSKPTYTGTIMKWYATAPLWYKTNLVMDFVNSIWSATTNYGSFVRACEKAKNVLTKNYYQTNGLNGSLEGLLRKFINEEVTERMV